MGRACSKHEEDDKFIQNFLENLKRRDRVEDIGIKGRIMLEWIVGK
jgi:hypothetical protein